MSATTPRRTSMSANNNSLVSPSRRVLGDLTPQAINTPPKHTSSLEVNDKMRSQSPLKQVQTLSPHLLTNKENISMASVFNAGRKRSIYEVEGAENVESIEKAFGTDFVETITPIPTSALETLPNSIGDLDNDPGSPTEANTPTPEPDEPEFGGDVEEMVGNSQTSDQSFSAWVNYQACDTQQTSEQSLVIETATKEHQEGKIEDTEKTATKADLLRLRLGFGMYKIRTNQVNTSGSDILSRWESTSSVSNSLGSSASDNAITTSATSSSYPVPTIILSPAQCESVSHVKANLDPGRPIPKLAGGPVLLPTTYSSRMIHDYHMPSSPPQAITSPVRNESGSGDYRTPVAKRLRENDEYGEEDLEGMSPEEMLKRQRGRDFDHGDLTSSVVKGNAAKGLMELMAGRR